MAFESYSGLLTAYPYAALTSDSWTFRLYALASGALLALTVLLMGSALVVLLGATAPAAGGVFTLTRTFYFVVAILVVVPLVAPVLLVARRHRRKIDVAPGYDAALGAAGFLFVISLYVGLVISVPAEQQTPPPAAIEPVVSVLYALPPLAGLLPPTLGALAIWLVHRRLARGTVLA